MDAISSKQFEGIEASLMAMCWGDAQSFVTRGAAPVWTSTPDPRWVHYAKWLAAVDVTTHRQHLNSWLLITKMTARLADLPLMQDNHGQRCAGANVIALITKLLHEIEALHGESAMRATLIGTGPSIH